MLGIVTIHKVDREHAEMLIKEFDVAIVDASGNLLADLMGTSTFNHVQSCPSVLGFCSGRGTHEKVVLELAL